MVMTQEGRKGIRPALQAPKEQKDKPGQCWHYVTSSANFNKYCVIYLKNTTLQKGLHPTPAAQNFSLENSTLNSNLKT